MQELLDEIERELEEAKFTEGEFGDMAEHPGAKHCRIKTAGGWTLLAVEFPIEDQGFPPGSKGYDGHMCNRRRQKDVGSMNGTELWECDTCDHNWMKSDTKQGDESVVCPKCHTVEYERGEDGMYLLELLDGAPTREEGLKRWKEQLRA